MTKSGFILPDTCTVAGALRKYSGHISWCTRYKSNFTNLNCSLTSNRTGGQTKLWPENEVAVVGQIAEFLVQKKFEKAKDHQDEVKYLEDKVAAAWDRYQTNIHTRAATATASPAAKRRPTQYQIPNL